MQELFIQSYTIISKYISLLFNIEQLNKLISNYQSILIKKSISTHAYEKTEARVNKENSVKENTKASKNKEDDMNDFIWGTYIQS